MSIEDRPPWREFPNHPPFALPVNQGDGEGYWFYEWTPFWNGLSAESKLKYLREHNAPGEWFEWLKPGGGQEEFRRQADQPNSSPA
jgi:hypothetical protein